MLICKEHPLTSSEFPPQMEQYDRTYENKTHDQNGGRSDVKTWRVLGVKSKHAVGTSHRRGSAIRTMKQDGLVIYIYRERYSTKHDVLLSGLSLPFVSTVSPLLCGRYIRYLSS
jgi:hypothetical protein